jgi:hypothetical protein
MGAVGVEAHSVVIEIAESTAAPEIQRALDQQVQNDLPKN